MRRRAVCPHVSGSVSDSTPSPNRTSWPATALPAGTRGCAWSRWRTWRSPLGCRRRGQAATRPKRTGCRSPTRAPWRSTTARSSRTPWSAPARRDRVGHHARPAELPPQGHRHPRLRHPPERRDGRRARQAGPALPEGFGRNPLPAVAQTLKPGHQNELLLRVSRLRPRLPVWGLIAGLWGLIAGHSRMPPGAPSGFGASPHFVPRPGRLFPSLRVIRGGYRQF